jgi:hypothetical protein
LNQLAALLIGLMLSQAALACTTDAWNGGVAGDPVPLAGSPAPDGVARITGLCGMQQTVPGSVKDTSPVAEADAFIRFYVLADLASGNPVIFEGFSDDGATGSLFTVAYDGVNFSFDAGDGASGPVPGVTGWNIVEMYWVGGTSLEFWVNTPPADPATGSISAAAGTLESVVLGAATALDGTLTFDDYESHRDTPVGPSDVCNADASGPIDLLDALEVVDEYFAPPLSPDLAVGSPDCDLSGIVDLLDALEIVDIYFGT